MMFFLHEVQVRPGLFVGSLQPSHYLEILAAVFQEMVGQP